MDILAANVIVYLTRYAVIIRQFFKSNYVRLLIEILKWEILAYSFSLVKGYTATLCYMFLIIYEVMKFTKMNKSILIDILMYLLFASFIYLGGKYSIFHLLPYIALFLNMVLKPILNKYKKNTEFVSMIIDLLICIYAYRFSLYVLFIFNVFKIIFPILGTSIKSLTDFANKRIK